MSNIKIYRESEIHDIIIQCNAIEMQVKRIKDILNEVIKERATT